MNSPIFSKDEVQTINNSRICTNNLSYKIYVINASTMFTFLWRMASLMVFSLLPFFLTEELHVSKTTLGFL
jgi:hypothetical protein